MATQQNKKFSISQMPFSRKFKVLEKILRTDGSQNMSIKGFAAAILF
jgi:hypothetical protein